VAKLRAEHVKGNKEMGLDLYNGTVANARQLGITESFKLKNQVGVFVFD
jgi:T-complex protein 1 subunit beta